MPPLFMLEPAFSHMTHPLPEPEIILQQKKNLRRAMRETRRTIPAGLREKYNAALNQQLMNRLLDLSPCKVSAYLAFDGEPDLSPSFPALREAGFQLALPFIETQADSTRMVFRRWQASDALSANTLGFSEPRQGEELDPSELGVVLMPLVAWDINGTRLGMGAGYYDRALAPLRHQARPLRIGIAFDAQRTDKIPTDRHDIPLHELISESQRFTFPA